MSPNAPDTGATKSSPAGGVSDDALLQRAGSGDPRAFMELYDRFAPRIMGLLVKIVRNRTDAEDAMQTVAIDIWRRASTYDPSLGSASTWILMVARARGIDAVRRIVRTHPTRADLDHDTPRTTMDANAPIDSALPLDHALASIPHEQRDAIELAFYRGLTREQAAEALGVPVGTLKTRIRTGVRSLGAALGAQERGHS